MPDFTGTDPARFIADFFTSFNEQLLADDEDSALVVDRFHTPDIVQVADGHRMDRAKLIAHTRPIRKNRPRSHIDVHEAIADNDRVAARYTLHVQQRGKALAIEVCFFGRFAPDGRMRQAHMLTRTAAADRADGRHRAQRGAMSETRYTVLGMTCDHCAASVTEAIEAVPGVAAVAVDVGADSVTVTSTGDLAAADVRAAVEAAGFELTSS